jgi:hypothetical protein
LQIAFLIRYGPFLKQKDYLMSVFGSHPPSVVPSLGTATSNYTATPDHLFDDLFRTAQSLDDGSAIALSDKLTPTDKVDFVLSPPKIQSIDLDGVDGAQSNFQEVVRPNLLEFHRNPSARTAANAALSLWALFEWLWCERHPTEAASADRKRAFNQFCASQTDVCHQIAYVRDIAEAWKHCRLSRRDIKTARTNAPRLQINLNDGTTRSMADVFDAVAEHLKRELFSGH